MAPNRESERHLIHGTHDGYHNHGCRCRPCKNAFARWYWGYMTARAQDTPCLFPGCPNGIYAKGYCKAHYEQQRTGKELVPVKQRLGGRNPMPNKRRLDDARPEGAS